jgi:hypothetical protein
MRLRAKIQDVGEAIEDLRACLIDPIKVEEAKLRGIVARNACAELKRYMEEELS